MNFDFDCFVADVKSFNPVTGVASIAPRFVYQDGSTPAPFDAKTLGGIVVEQGDLVAVLTTKNNLDNKTVNAYFPRSLANCRIFSVIAPMGGVFLFKGNYKFDGNFEITGTLHTRGAVTLDDTLEVQGDTTLDQKLEVKLDVTLDQKLEVKQDVTLDKKLKVKDDATFDQDAVFGVTQISFLNHTHANNAPIPGPTGPPT